ncbi:MAG TPA: hypothetical protein VGL82_00450 [Bryobacteraceae bacterium]|jgi:hypothetical protein
MENFRDFEAGPDPFGRMWHAQFKYLQTGISIRHSDSVDVCFVLENGDDPAQLKTVVIQNADIRAYSKRTGRLVSDPWCSRIAMCKLQLMIETAEDMEKYYLPVPPQEIEEYDAKIKKWEDEWSEKHAA